MIFSRMHILMGSNGIALDSTCHFVSLLASKSALLLPSISTCDGIHWNSIILPFIVSSRITCFILPTIKDSERCRRAIVSMADPETTRITAFSKDPILDCRFITAKKKNVCE
ncbi:hypothetical protein NPIL_109811 [Nephila pilipes]|uniref:Uncharacterized protein n=1 Tax=Nephila pilipes TaxID=299642 RepID=A0A8X6MJL3_NEPPI|nr:hypothetical protein NPIL_109811 [Nephila pilipes]